MLFPVRKAGGFLETGVCLLVKGGPTKSSFSPNDPGTWGWEREALGLEKFLIYIREEKNLEGVLLFLSQGDLGLSDLHIDPRIESIYVKEIGLGIQCRYSPEYGLPEGPEHLSTPSFRASREIEISLCLARKYRCLNRFCFSNCVWFLLENHTIDF